MTTTNDILNAVYGTEGDAFSPSAARPGDVTGLEITRVTADQVTVQWYTPTGGGAYSGFEFLYWKISNGVRFTEPHQVMVDPGPPGRWQGVAGFTAPLTALTAYGFSVQAVGAGGVGGILQVFATTSG